MVCQVHPDQRVIPVPEVLKVWLVLTVNLAVLAHLVHLVLEVQLVLVCLAAQVALVKTDYLVNLDFLVKGVQWVLWDLVVNLVCPELLVDLVQVDLKVPPAETDFLDQWVNLDQEAPLDCLVYLVNVV